MKTKKVLIPMCVGFLTLGLAVSSFAGSRGNAAGGKQGGETPYSIQERVMDKKPSEPLEQQERFEKQERMEKQERLREEKGVGDRERLEDQERLRDRDHVEDRDRLHDRDRLQER